jgi:hypothetical protein
MNEDVPVETKETKTNADVALVFERWCAHLTTRRCRKVNFCWSVNSKAELCKLMNMIKTIGKQENNKNILDNSKAIHLLIQKQNSVSLWIKEW